MSTDFKELWNREEDNVPDINEVFMKANKMNRSIRKKVWRENVVLGLTVIFISWVWWYYQPQMLLTKIGMVMIIGAVIAFLTASNQLLPLLNTGGDIEADSKQYLAQLMRIKQKQEFIGGTMLLIYFILLSTGLALYMVEYAIRGSVAVRISFYGITFGWIALCWFYLAPRGVKKQRRAINDVIARLEVVNGQLNSEG